jgi:CO/xanthine dehydrogenase FAD-binding subunit
VGEAVKPAAFDYRAPRGLEEALGLLDEDARALAGGQSLIPLLNFRLARPERLVDLNGIPELSYLRRSGGVLRIGAMTRQATLERSRMVAEHWPLLTQAVRLVGHPQIRNRGTVGGSVAHADPASELPAAMLALDARFHLRSVRGARALPAGEFFLGSLETALEPDELLTEVEVPALPDGAATAFREHARTQCDFASAGAAVVLATGRHAAIALLGAAPTPVRAAAAERAVLAGAGAREAGEAAAEGIGDDHRCALVAELVRRAIEEAGG